MDNHLYDTPFETKAIRKENSDIPFKEMVPGKSVYRRYEEVNELSLRSRVSTVSKKYKYDFVVIKHAKERYFEIACTFKKQFESDRSNEIVDSSPLALEQIAVGLKGKRKYPFYELSLQEGKSFIVPLIETVNPETNEVTTNEKSLRVACCVQSKKLDSNFICVKHDNYKMLEVYHQPTLKPTLYDPSVEALAKGAIQ